MRKLIPYLIGIILAVQATTPPFELSIQFTNGPVSFVWTFLFFGVLSLYFIFTKANIYLKIIVPYLFLNTFFSRMPHSSMTTFIYIMVGAYFYLLCLECRDWKPVFKILSCILLLQSLLLLFRSFGLDKLLNFGDNETICFGSVGNPMQFKSLVFILIAFLLQSMESIKKYLKWLYIVFIPIFIYIVLIPNFWFHFSYSRVAVWFETLKLIKQHPFVGWGVGTYKSIFPAIARGHFEVEGVWQNAHNEPLEFLFNIGIIGIIPLILYVIYLCKGCRELKLLGTLIIAYTLCLYFPFHQPHTSLLLIAFVAFREIQIRST